jgi:Zn-dependent metalloprotease
MKKIFILLIFSVLANVKGFAQGKNPEAISEFVSKTNSDIKYDKVTGSINVIRFQYGKEYKSTSGNPEQKALAFMQNNEKMFAFAKTKDSYTVKKSLKNNIGNDRVELQHYYKGVPVFDGLVKFHFNKMGDISSVNGNFISIDKLNPVPSITEQIAQKIALKTVEGQNIDVLAAPLQVKNTDLFVIQKGMVKGADEGKFLVYRIEISNEKNVREYVFVDAHTGQIVEQFTGMHHVGLDRKLYNGNTQTANLLWTEGDALPGTLTNNQQTQIEVAGQMYRLMKYTFGHASYNGAPNLATEAPMVTVTNAEQYTNCVGNPNANWNGVTTNFCENVGSDDVVAHEWAHAYTEYTNNLIYSYQSGALNEAYSDVWGETVDLINNYDDVGENNGPRTAGCGSTNRWQVGEATDIVSGVPVGLFRDMWDPECFSDPAKISDNTYWCNTGDNGGVHINSGVINHLYALLVDGGTYNGQTITGIGLTKAAHLFWYAQTEMVTSTTNFSEFADYLETSMQELIASGANLNALSTTATSSSPSGQIMNASDAAELAKALLAVELRMANECNFPPNLLAVPDVCEGGLPNSAIFYEDFEDGLASWTTTNQAGLGSDFTPRNWVSLPVGPDAHSSKVAFAINYTGGNCDTVFENGLINLTSPTITMPVGSVGPYTLAFDHYFATEARFDGGIVQYSLDGGAFTQVPISAFINNSYNEVLETADKQNDNPLAGLPAYSGTDPGQFKGSWGQSRINLSTIGLINPGQNIAIRWVFGSDGCGGLDGWYLDDVKVYSCTKPTVQFVASTSTANEAEALTANNCLPYIDKTVTMRINKSPSANTTINIQASGTATQGATADFTISPSSSTFVAGGATTQNFTVRIYNDGYIETPETIVLSYTIDANGGDAIPEAINQTHTITVTDNEIDPGVTTIELINTRFSAANNTTPPEGWTVFNHITNAIAAFAYPVAWGGPQFQNLTLDPTGRRMAMINSDANRTVEMDMSLITNPVNTVGMSSITLNYDEFFRVFNGDFSETAKIDVWDGSTWQNVLTQNESTGNSGSWAAPFNRTINIPVAYANAAMQLRFRYNAFWDWYWVIDNVKLTGQLPTEVHTSVNTGSGSSQYLGPNATAVFYDPTTGDLLAKIKNLTNHDYGCTTVEVDRAGVGFMPWVLGYQISNKTLKITPAINNPTGQYELTIYYKANEIAGVLANVSSMGKSSGSIATGNTGLYAEVNVQSIFNADYAFSSTFDSGFSGFGLSNAPAIGALAVKLVQFTGKNTAQGNLISWQTATETDNAYFVLERSTNAQTFEGLTTIEGKGSTAETSNYQYVDTQIQPGQLYYYRLKDVSNSGKTNHSSIISVKATAAGQVTIYPNPTEQLLNIQNDTAEQLKNLTIYNTTGQRLLHIPLSKKQIDIRQLPQGSYVLYFEDANGKHQSKFSKH